MTSHVIPIRKPRGQTGESIVNKSNAMHEMLEVHEIVAFKTVGLTKSKTMQALVTDPELKLILQQDAAMSSKHLYELRALLTESKAAVQDMNFSL